MANLTFYNAFRTEMVVGNPVSAINFATNDGSIKIALVDNSYTPSAANDQYFHSSTSAQSPDTHEMANGNGYTTGGIGLAGNSYSVSGSTVTVKLGVTAGVNPTWAQNPSGFSTARYAVIYKSTGTNSTSPLIAYIALGADQGNVNGDFTIGFDQGSNGAFTLT